METTEETIIRPPWTMLVSTVCVLFGLLTAITGALALFGGELTRATVGDAVPFVLWFNFLAGFLYVLAGVGLYRQTRWAAPLSVSIAVATVTVLLLFLWHVTSGKPYEMRTVAAMLLRSGVWISVAVFACRNPGRRPGPTVLT